MGRFVFSDTAVLIARLLLLAAVVAVGGWYWLRLRALRSNGGAAQLERALPAQGGRVTTYLQESSKEGKASILLDLLAEDSRRIAEQEALATSIPARKTSPSPAKPVPARRRGRAELPARVIFALVVHGLPPPRRFGARS